MSTVNIVVVAVWNLAHLQSGQCPISLSSYTDVRSISLQKVNKWKLSPPRATNRRWHLYQFGFCCFMYSGTVFAINRLNGHAFCCFFLPEQISSLTTITWSGRSGPLRVFRSFLPFSWRRSVDKVRALGILAAPTLLCCTALRSTSRAVYFRPATHMLSSASALSSSRSTLAVLEMEFPSAPVAELSFLPFVCSTSPLSFK